MGERGIRLVFGFGRRIRLLVLGRREFDLSGFVGHQVWKKCVQWGGSRQWTKSKASMQRATLRREERVERPARERRRSCSMLPLDCSPRRSSKCGRKDRRVPTNYRPISLTSCVARLMEKIINVQVLDYLQAPFFISINLAFCQHTQRLHNWFVLQISSKWHWRREITFKQHSSI